MKSDSRNYGLDLYKALCLLFVISFHYSYHGVTQLISDTPLTANWILLVNIPASGHHESGVKEITIPV